MTMYRSFLTVGVRYMLLSTFFFTLFQGLVKYLGHLPSHEHVLLRSAITWIFSVAYLTKMKVSWRGKNTKLLIQRGIVGTISTLAFLYAVQHMPFGSAVTIKYLSPIFTAMLAVIFLNEKLKRVQWLFFCMSFLGVALLKGFDMRVETFSFVMALVSAFSGGVLYITIRKIGDDDHPLVVVHYFMLVAILTSSVFCLQEWVMPHLQDVPWLLLLGIAGFYAQYYMTLSLQAPENTSYLVFFKYLEAVYALVVGFIWFEETYTLLSFLGIALIFTSLILNIRVQNQGQQAQISKAEP